MIHRWTRRDITDFVVVLNSDEAVKSFSMGGNVTIGGESAYMPSCDGDI